MFEIERNSWTPSNLYKWISPAPRNHLNAHYSYLIALKIRFNCDKHNSRYCCSLIDSSNEKLPQMQTITASTKKRLNELISIERCCWRWKIGYLSIWKWKMPKMSLLTAIQKRNCSTKTKKKTREWWTALWPKTKNETKFHTHSIHIIEYFIIYFPFSLLTWLRPRIVNLCIKTEAIWMVTVFWICFFVCP